MIAVPDNPLSIYQHYCVKAGSVVYVTKGGERRGTLLGLVQRSKLKSTSDNDTVKSVMIPYATTPTFQQYVPRFGSGAASVND